MLRDVKCLALNERVWEQVPVEYTAIACSSLVRKHDFTCLQECEWHFSWRAAGFPPLFVAALPKEELDIEMSERAFRFSFNYLAATGLLDQIQQLVEDCFPLRSEKLTGEESHRYPFGQVVVSKISKDFSGFQLSRMT